MIDDLCADLRQAVDVRLAGAEVAAFDRVVEKPGDAVPVVLVILRGVDPALCGYAVGAAGAILEAETIHLIPQLPQS